MLQFFHFISNTFEVETKLDLPLSVKFILMKDMSSNSMLELEICWVHNNNNFLVVEGIEERILYQQRNWNEGWSIE